MRPGGLPAPRRVPLVIAIVVTVGMLVAWSMTSPPGRRETASRVAAPLPAGLGRSQQGPAFQRAVPETTEQQVASRTPQRVSLTDGRSYQLLAHLGTPAPLVVALSGFANTPDDLAHDSDLTAFARGHGFSLAYGIPTALSWNAGPQCCGKAARDDVDDIGYLDDLITDVGRRADVDPRRVWLIGFSNGGMLAARGACELPQVTAAVTVSGPLLLPCPRPVRLLDIHGVTDQTVPLLGGWSGLTHTVFPDTETEGARLPAGSQWALVTWSGGHEWPTGAGVPTPVIGEDVRVADLDATATAWDFLTSQSVARRGDAPQITLGGREGVPKVTVQDTRSPHPPQSRFRS